MDSSHAEEKAKDIYSFYQQVVQIHDQAEWDNEDDRIFQRRIHLPPNEPVEKVSFLKTLLLLDQI